MALLLRCRACGQEHEFPIIVGRRTFEALANDFRSEWTRSWFRCPRSGRASSVANTDLYWKD